MKIKSEKIKWVSEKERFVKEVNALLFADYRGVKVRDITDLRRQLRRNSASMEVVKNRLFKRIVGSEWNDISPFFEGPTAVIYSDPGRLSEVCKLLASFEKENESFKLRGGYIRPQKILRREDIIEISKIPDRQTLLATLVMAMKSPVYGFHRVCKTLISQVAFVLRNYADKKAGRIKD